MDAKTNVKEWYCSTYPDDDMGKYIDPEINFQYVWDAMLDIDFYAIIEVCDSVIRERVFEQLTKIFNIPYWVIYQRWMDSDDSI